MFQSEVVAENFWALTKGTFAPCERWNSTNPEPEMRTVGNRRM